MKNALPVLLLLLFCCAASAQNAPYVPEELVVTANSLNLRKEANINSEKLASVPRGARMQFLEAHDNGAYVQADSLDPSGVYAPWYKVRYQNKTGYVFGAYVSGRFNLYNDGEFMDVLPVGLLWYGVYARDSFADEIRKVEVKIVEEYNEMFGEMAKILHTNQTDRAKFLIGTADPLKTGYAGPLGMLDILQTYYTTALNPGATVALYNGNDIQNPADTLAKTTYALSAIGCVELRDNMMHYNSYQLLLLDYSAMEVQKQDLTAWFRTAMPELNPTISLYWMGDIDMDGKPDAVIQDCPEEMGCRISLFLSSEAKGEDRWKKVCESFFAYD